MANTISTTIAVNDNMSKAFQSMNKSINLLISSFETLERSSSNAIDTESLSQARKYINDAQRAFEDVDESIEQAKQSQDTFNRSILDGSNHAGKFKSALSAVAKVGAVAITGMAAAVSGLVGASVNQYADYEQLVGGIETLFGAGGRSVEEYAASVGKSVSQIQGKYDGLMTAQNSLMADAENAYKTAGLSANDYMETVTGFSASLISSLNGDTTKAASYANQALVDMSDNANKMGTDMESIQNAYQGFAKQNYTMLDNLKLGYGGTKEEMQRLLSDAEKLTNQKYDISSFADITQAIHAIQTQMDITGTTAKEASTTISGSFNSMKAAFQNTLVGLTTGGEMFDKSLDALIDTAITFGENIMPAIEGALSGVGHLIEGLAPVIAQVIPTLISDLLPSLVNGVVQVVTAIGNMIVENKDIVVNAAAELATAIINGLWTILTGQSLDPAIFDGLANAITNVLNLVTDLLGGIMSFIGSDAGIVTLTAAFTALGLSVAAVKISSFISKIKGLSDVGTFASGLKTLAMSTQIATAAQWLFNTSLYGCPIIWIIAAIAALIAIIVLCVQHWDEIKAAALSCWESIKSAWGTVVDWFKGIWESIKSGALAIWEKIKSVFSSVINWIKENFVSIIAFIINPFAGIFSYLYDHCEGFRNIVNNVVNAIKNFFTGLWESIKSGAQSAWAAITGVFTSIWNTISPLVMAIWNLISTVFTTISSIISAIMQGIWATIQTVWTAISTTISNVCTSIWNTIVAIWNAIVAFIAPILQSIWNTVTTVWNAIWTTITTVCTAIWNTIVNVWNSIVSSVTTAINAVKSVITSIWNNIKSVTSSVWDSIKNAISNAWTAIVTAVTNKVQEVYNKIKSKFDEILSFIGSLKDQMIQKGKDIIQGLIDGIASKINAVADKIKEVGSTVTNGIKNFFNIGSPSKVMHALGEFTFAGFNNGLQAMIDKIKRTTVNMGEVVTNVLPVQQNKPETTLKTPEDFTAMRQVVSNKTNTYTTIKAPITVQVKNSNNFKTEADLSKFTRNLANGIAQQIGIQLEGAY